MADIDPRCTNCDAKPGDPVVCWMCPDEVRYPPGESA